jgi:hypothetical protein
MSGLWALDIDWEEDDVPAWQAGYVDVDAPAVEPEKDVADEWDEEDELDNVMR